MSNWTALRLGDHATTYAGGTPDRSRPEFFGGVIPWVKSTEVNLGKIYHTEETLSDLGLRCSAAKWIPEQTVLVALYGATAAQIGFLKIRATANQAVLAIVPDTQLDSTFLFYALTAAKAKILFQAQGSGQPNLNKQIIDSLLLDTPPLPEQRKIARILTTLDNLIEKTEALIAKYQAIKQGMMHDLFTRGVDEHGHLRPPYEEAPELYKQSELGWIPKEWACVRCTEVCREIVVGIVIQPAKYYQSEGVPVLRSANVRETGIVGTDLVFMSDESNRLLAKSMLRTGDVVTVRTGYPGTSCVVSPEYDGSNCVDIIISRPGPKVRSQFLATWINSDSGKNQVLRKQGGLAQQHFNVGELKDLLLVLPSLDEQAVIESVLHTQKSEIQTGERHRDKLHLLKTGLMQDLFTGKVRMKVDEAEEVTRV
ncbi:EcoKI restriction-modification system protein HsdS [Anatilimnocola aggregata]|uniref:EcoKI restriction-modification system protein HsdS n=1 Tax=Anatilimnocola aggregata TaxID=2528021 RepID=A0A517Y6U1_9BACT|nr:restriction endonuclease subunit S [Anatilimnocola aggregata]QDU25852.1 EcoKI restriction-modification system protein HsdS [Anatilimnocola aggregata]